MSGVPDIGLDPTQVLERSPDHNPPAKSVAKLRARHDEISQGNGRAKDASREDSIAYPQREIPGVA